MAAFSYPSFGQAPVAEVPNYAWAAANQGILDQNAKLLKQQQLKQAVRDGSELYGGISNVMNPPGTKPEDFREPVTTAFRAAKDKIQALRGPQMPQSTGANPAQAPQVPQVQGGGGLGVPGQGPRGAPPPQRMPQGLTPQPVPKPAANPGQAVAQQAGDAAGKQQAVAQVLRSPTKPMANPTSAMPKAAAPAAQGASTLGKIGQAAGTAGQVAGYAGAGLSAADAVGKFRSGDNKGGGKSAANAIGSGMMTAGLANAYNPLGWGLMAGGAAAQLYGMFG